MENGLAVALAAVRNALQARQKASPALQTLARVRERICFNACVLAMSLPCLGQFNISVKQYQVQMANGNLQDRASGVLSSMVDGLDSNTGKNAIYIGLFGNGWLYSVNYDRSWKVKMLYLSMSMGCGYLPDYQGGPQASKFSLPIQFNVFHGHNSFMEHGIGLTYGSGWNATTAEGGIQSNAIHLFLKPIGYRYQAETGGLFIRVNGLVPIKLVEFNDAWTSYDSDSNEPMVSGVWFGVDVGYTFEGK